MPVLFCALPDYPAPCPNYLYKKKLFKFIFQNFILFIYFYLQNVIAVFVFSDSRCKNACNC